METWVARPTPRARKWTKERLKRHPGTWAIQEPPRSVPCWPGEDAVMLRNVDDGWSAWFPAGDIQLETATSVEEE